jgi:hypothetical protein
MGRSGPEVGGVTVNSQLHQFSYFVRFNEEAHDAEGYASYASAPGSSTQGPTLALEHALEQYCPLTVDALRMIGMWAADFGDFAMRSRVLDTANDAGPRFLAEMAGHPHALVASVAQFEAAMKKVREGHTDDQVIGWSHSPNRVLAALREGERLDLDAARGSFWTIVAHDLPGNYHVLAVGVPDGNQEPRDDRRPVGVRY